MGEIADSLRSHVHAQPGIAELARKRRATCPLPADVREAVIEHLTKLLVAEVERNPEAYLRPECSNPDTAVGRDSRARASGG